MVAGGLDLHRGQLTFDYVDLGTGESWRGGCRQRTGRACAGGCAGTAPQCGARGGEVHRVALRRGGAAAGQDYGPSRGARGDCESAGQQAAVQRRTGPMPAISPAGDRRAGTGIMDSPGACARYPRLGPALQGSARGAHRACGFPAHASPTPFTAGIRPSPPVPEGPGVDDVPDRVTSPSWFGDWQVMTDQPNSRDRRWRLAMNSASRIRA